MVGRAGSSCARATCPLSSLLVSGGQGWKGTWCHREGRLVWKGMSGSGDCWAQGPVTPDMVLSCGQACLLSCGLSSS